MKQPTVGVEMEWREVSSWGRNRSLSAGNSLKNHTGWNRNENPIAGNNMKKPMVGVEMEWVKYPTGIGIGNSPTGMERGRIQGETGSNEDPIEGKRMKKPTVGTGMEGGSTQLE